MSNIDKRAVQAVADLKAGYTLGHADVEIIQQMALDAVTLMDELEAKDKQIAELEAREVKLPKLKMLCDYLSEVTHREREDILLGVKLEFHRELQAAGIRIKGEQ
ncbi:hypothetical protein R4Q63_002146 [Enterobacter cloacae]|nr:hypothetical protein [Enterobacter cloacae]